MSIAEKIGGTRVLISTRFLNLALSACFIAAVAFTVAANAQAQGNANFEAGIGPSPIISFGTPATAYDTSRASAL